MKNESVDGEIPAANTTDTLAIAKGTPVAGEDVPLPSNEEKEETPIFGRHPFDEAWEEINGDGDAIRKVAEWAGFEKTALWCYRVGCCVSVLTRPITEDTLVDFKAALKMDPDFGAAHFRVATIYGELKQYDLAIKQMEEVKRVKYNESGGSLRRGAIWVAKWQEGKEDAPGTSEEAKTAGRQQAMKTLEAELEKSPEEFDLLAAYIEVAGKSGKHKAIMSKLLSLGAKLPEFVRSENVQENIGLHKTMRRAAQKTRRVGALKRAYEIAIEKDRLDKDMTEMPQRVYIHMDLIDSLANLYIENQEDDKALIQYQTLIDFADERDVSFYAYNGAMRIGLLHFLAACNKGSSEEERQEAIDALIKLEKEERDPDNNVISAAYTTHGLTLGLYYKLAGEPEKAHALFKDRIALAMTLLEDEDADNDWQGWESLTQTLFKDGDIENGRAAASMWYKEIKKIMGELIDEEKTEGKDEDEKKKSSEGAAPDAETNGKTAPAATQTRDGPVINGPKGTADASLEKSKEPNDTEKPEPETSLIYEDTPWQTGTCDGICDRDLRDYDKGIYICIHCTGMWLCVECWEKHQESSLPYLLCDSDHQFAYVTGPPKNLCVEKGHETIWVGGKVRDMKEWLGEIWERWGVWKKREEKEVKEVESGKVESGKVESGKVESGKVESGKVESGKVEG
jgi:tetratricopeptide (TPR) repeat protein